MGFTGVAELAHRIESLLDALRHGRVAVDAGHVPAALPGRWTRWSRAVEAAAAGREPRRTRCSPWRWRRPPSAARPAGRPRRRARRRRRQVIAGGSTDAPRARSVQLHIRSDAVMRGARAVLAVRRAEALGRSVRASAVAGAARARGVRRPTRLSGSSRAPPTRSWPPRSGAPARSRRCASRSPSSLAQTAGASATARSAWTSRRLDRLMKQVGELVVAKNRLGVLAGTRRRPRARRGERADLAPGLGHAGRGDRLQDDAGRRGVRALSPAGARLGPRSGQAHPVRRRRRGDRAGPLDSGRDRRPAAAPDPQRCRSWDRAARSPRRPPGSRRKDGSCSRPPGSGTA